MNNNDLRKLCGKTIKQIYWSINALNIEFNDGTGVQIQFSYTVDIDAEYVDTLDT